MGNPNYLLHVHHNWIIKYTSYAHVGRTKRKKKHICEKEDKCKNILRSVYPKFYPDPNHPQRDGSQHTLKGMKLRIIFPEHIKKYDAEDDN